MSPEEVILITGVSNYWGSKLVRNLQVKKRVRVLGIDTNISKDVYPNIDFIQADLQNPLLPDLLISEDVSIVCHLACLENPPLKFDPFHSNVIGTIKLFEACKNANVHTLIFKSSSFVYGAHPTNSALILEEYPLRGNRNIGYIRDLIEIESFINTYTSRNQFPKVTTLRFANILGSKIENYFTRYLNSRFILTLLGFNPRLQVVHEYDVINALVHAMFNKRSGIFNIAAEGIFTLNKLIGMCGKTSIPMFPQALIAAEKVFYSKDIRKIIEFFIESRFLKYPFVVDIHKMKNQFGYEPAYTAEEAIREFAVKIFPHKESDELPYTELEVELLRDTIERRNRVRENKSYTDNLTGNIYES